jgi:hypothetical protein
VYNIDLGDVDGDGHLDLAIGIGGSLPPGHDPEKLPLEVLRNGWRGRVVLAKNTGDGTFERMAQYSTESPAKGVALADLDNDGKLDLLYTSRGSGYRGDTKVGKLLIRQGLGHWKFGPAMESEAGPSAYYVETGDLNNDGYLDILVPNEHAPSVYYFINPGDPLFENAKALSQSRRVVRASQIPGRHYAQVNDVRAADLNGDGNLDLVTANLQTATLSIFIGNGDGTFQQDSLIEGGKYNAFLAVDDLDNDGDNDIVVTHWRTDTMAVLLNRGDGQFSPRTDYKTGLRNYGVAIADANGDEILDVITANYEGHSMSLLEGVGDGTFEPAVTTAKGIRQNNGQWIPLAAVTGKTNAQRPDKPPESNNPSPTETATQFFQHHPNEIDLTERGNSILFANRQIGIEFRRSERGFQLNRVYGIERNQDFLVTPKTGAFENLFEIRMTEDPRRLQRDDRGKTRHGHFKILEEMAGDDPFMIGSNQASEISWRREGNATKSVLHLEWKKIDAREDKGVMDVEVTVTLRADDPISYWRINTLNRSPYGTGRRHYPRFPRYGIERVRFPLLALAPIENAEDNVFLSPAYRGELFPGPFRDGYNTTAFYPHNFNMQFQALYNKKHKSGLYLGTQDPSASFMVYDIRHRASKILWTPGHFPPNITFAGQDFNLPYDVVVGPYQGDWYDACQRYRAWAQKQFWCSKGKLAQRQDIPAWYKHTPLFFYAQLGDSAEGTHNLDENLVIAEQHFHEFLQWAEIPLPANFYQLTRRIPGLSAYDLPLSVYRAPRPGRWAGFSSHEVHAGNYPDIPVLPGVSAAVGRLRQAGGMVCPYLPLEIFDAGPTNNAPRAAEAAPNLVRDLYGATRRWGTNGALQACVVTPWWRNRLKETCELMMERENVSGFYLDVLQGCSLPCYWTPHGHTAAGGDSMTRGMHELVEMVTNAVKAKDSEAITTGENSAENMIDVTDGILQVSLFSRNTAPLFATVYQDYILRYGLELSVGPGWHGRYEDSWREDAFFIECASMFVEGMQVGRIRLRPRDNNISFQNPKHKELLDFLERIVGYYKQEQAREFLAYGQLLRPLTFKEPAAMPMLFYKSSINNSEGKFPALMSGVFRSADGALGVFVANASSQDLRFYADLDLSSCGLSEGTSVTVASIDPDGNSKEVLSKTKGIVPLKSSLPAHHVTMFRLN